MLNYVEFDLTCSHDRSDDEKTCGLRFCWIGGLGFVVGGLRCESAVSLMVEPRA